MNIKLVSAIVNQLAFVALVRRLIFLWDFFIDSIKVHLSTDIKQQIVATTMTKTALKISFVSLLR